MRDGIDTPYRNSHVSTLDPIDDKRIRLLLLLLLRNWMVEV